jgi:multidrug efflux pump subunit AcrA (membrane-fusion protein)
LKISGLLAKVLPIVIIALAASAFAYMKATKPERPRPQPREKVWLVETMSAQPQTLAPSLTLYGAVESNALLRAAAPGAGQVDQVYVKAGDRVSRAEKLVELDRRDFDTTRLQAAADVADIEAQLAEHELKNRANLKALEEEEKLLTLARQESQRIERLKKNNLSSDSALNDAREMLGRQELSLIQKQLEVDRYATTSKQIKARLARARARLSEVNLALERSSVVADFDGIVSQVAVAAGDRVRVADLLVSLYPLDSLEVRARVPATYQSEIAEQLASGQGLDARADLNGKAVQLELVRLAGYADPSGIDAYFRVVSNAAQLRLGNLVEIELKRPIQHKVLAVPFSAIYGNDRVFVLRDGRMRAFRVESVGQVRDAQGQSKLLVRNQDIEAGDAIIVTHLPNAVDGLKVKQRGSSKVEQDSESEAA